MNTLLVKMSESLKLVQSLRYYALDQLTDADLAFTLPGNLTLGALFKQEGEFEQSYIDSYKRMRQDFLYRQEDSTIETNVEALRNWFKSLDESLDKALLALTEEEIQSRVIDRGGWTVSPSDQADNYFETLLIFYGKLDVYLKALGKPLSEMWVTWIG